MLVHEEMTEINLDDQALKQLFSSLVSIHKTTRTLTKAVYDLCTSRGSGVVKRRSAELGDGLGRWDIVSVNKLRKMGSFIKQ
jgi:hypothetical protein